MLDLIKRVDEVEPYQFLDFLPAKLRTAKKAKAEGEGRWVPLGGAWRRTGSGQALAPSSREVRADMSGRTRRSAEAVRTAGDTIIAFIAFIAFIAYVAFGPQALPMQTLYEVRLLDQHGDTVPGTIRTNLPAGRVTKAGKHLMTVNGPAHAYMHGHRWNPSHHRIQITPF